MTGKSIQQDLYADPMLYDILHTPGTAVEVSAFEKVEAALADRPLAYNRLWFEPACGTGRYMRVAAHRGRKVAGFDLDEGQLRYARKRKISGVKSADSLYFQADMQDFISAASNNGYSPHSVDFAFNPVNSLRLLKTDEAMLAHFNQMAAILKPDAVYVVGISLTDYDWMFSEEDLWEGVRGQIKVSQLVNYIPPEAGPANSRVEKVISHLTVSRPSGEAHFDDSYGIRTYDGKQWRDLVGKSGLKHVGSFDAWGQPLGDRVLPYQLEALGIRKK